MDLYVSPSPISLVLLGLPQQLPLQTLDLLLFVHCGIAYFCHLDLILDPQLEELFIFQGDDRRFIGGGPFSSQSSGQILLQKVTAKDNFLCALLEALTGGSHWRLRILFIMEDFGSRRPI